MEAKAGTYKVIVRCIGYEPLQKELLLPASMHDTLSLKASSYALKEVVVQAKNIERKADRFVLSVSPSTGKDGTELLSQAPAYGWQKIISPSTEHRAQRYSSITAK